MYSADCADCTVCTVEASLPPMDSWTHGLLDAGCRREDNRQEDADAGFVKMIFLKKGIVL